MAGDAKVDLSFENWHVALPSRRGQATSSSRGGPVKSFSERIGKSSVKPSTASTAAPSTALTEKAIGDKAAAERAATIQARFDDQVKVEARSEARPQTVEPTKAAPHKSARSDDPDIPIAREDVTPRSQRYGPERLRLDYHPPTDVSATARNLPPPEPPRHGGIDQRVNNDVELERGFAGNIRNKLEALQAKEGISRRGIGELPAEREARATQASRAVSTYARLQDLQGRPLMNELEKVGKEMMQRNPIGTPVATLREQYGELVHFVSERTGVSQERIYRVMDLESYGGQYWAEHSTSGACGLVQVRPIALEEMQRLRPEEFATIDFDQIRQNPALNLYTGMSYAAEKGQDWNHYSGGASGYADYVINGATKPDA